MDRFSSPMRRVALGTLSSSTRWAWASEWVSSYRSQSLSRMVFSPPWRRRALLLQPGQLLLGGRSPRRCRSGSGGSGPCASAPGPASPAGGSAAARAGPPPAGAGGRSGSDAPRSAPVPGPGIHAAAGPGPPAAAVAVQVRHQLAQVRQGGSPLLTLGGQGGLLLLAAGDRSEMPPVFDCRSLCPARPSWACWRSCRARSS